MNWCSERRYNQVIFILYGDGMTLDFDDLIYSALDVIYKQFGSSTQGLSNIEAKKRQSIWGPNTYSVKKFSVMKLFLQQYNNAFTLLLLGACAISVMLQSQLEAIVIVSIVVVNGFLSFIQEYRAHVTIHLLKAMILPHAYVMRDNALRYIPAEEIVPGDIVSLNLGDKAPADMRLISCKNLSMNEAILTGESRPASKSLEVTNSSGGSTLPQAFIAAGTTVASGNGTGIVIAIGKETMATKMIKVVEEQQNHTSYFNQSLQRLSKLLVAITLIIVGVVFCVHLLWAKPLIEAFLFSLALALGITPELLPATMSITLARGALKMAQEHVVIKKMSAMEVFGNIDVLIADKTGTLTEGLLMIEKIIDFNESGKTLLYALLQAREFGRLHEWAANPVDKAIWEYKERDRLKPEMDTFKLIDSNQFDFTRLRSSILVERHHEKYIIVKGTTDTVLSQCTNLSSYPGTADQLRAEIRAQEATGDRVIMIAARVSYKESLSISDESDLTLIGYMTLSDPPKKTVPEALALIKNLNISLKIMSGDSPDVTRHTCNQVGIAIVDDTIITGAVLEKLSENEQKRYATYYNVFSQVTPQQKYQLITAIRQSGAIVGYLGDGVNDVPALVAADIGISVNTGVDMAKDVADVILLKKSLFAVGHGIVLGRKAFTNVMKYILIVTSGNFGSIITIGASSLFLDFIPLLPAQLLLMNFMTDIPLSCIAFDSVDMKLLKRPRRWDFGLIKKYMLIFGTISALFDVPVIIYFVWVAQNNYEIFRSGLFLEWFLSEIMVTFSLRTPKFLFFDKPGNMLMIVSVIMTIAAIILPYTQMGYELFKLVPINLFDWGVIMLVVSMFIATVEFIKGRVVSWATK